MCDFFWGGGIETFYIETRPQPCPLFRIRRGGTLYLLIVVPGVLSLLLLNGSCLCGQYHSSPSPHPAHLLTSSPTSWHTEPQPPSPYTSENMKEDSDTGKLFLCFFFHSDFFFIASMRKICAL